MWIILSAPFDISRDHSGIQVAAILAAEPAGASVRAVLSDWAVYKIEQGSPEGCFAASTFNLRGEKGIYAGKIKSRISSLLASHVRREAVRFIDELSERRRRR